MNSILHHTKVLKSCEAIGIRLYEMGEYPYYVYDGFPEPIAFKEACLCKNEKSGGNMLEPDETGYLLECMCRNVIQGRFDSTLSFFTKGGSFWSNNTSDLFTTAPEKVRQGRKRYACNVFGFESVALIPIKAHGKGTGLIQLNDKRVGILSEKSLSLWRW